jgi:kynurenine 3-monooxygenase
MVAMMLSLRIYTFCLASLLSGSNGFSYSRLENLSFQRYSIVTRVTLGSNTIADQQETTMTSDVIICGAGPAGLLSAIMMAQLTSVDPNHKAKITVLDRLSAPPSPTDDAVWSDVAKFYLIGLGARGQTALAEFGVWKDVESVCTAVVGRRDWSPESGGAEGVERIFTDRPVATQVLPRDKLVGVLHEHILQNYADQIELQYGKEVTAVNFAAGDDGNQVELQISLCQQPDETRNPVPSEIAEAICDPDSAINISAKLLIAADGTSRTIANKIEEADKQRFAVMNPLRRLIAGRPFRVKRYIDDNQRVYKTVPFHLPKEWRPDLNYSARSKGGRVVFDALPANRNGDYCGVLLLKADDPIAKADTDPRELRKIFDENLPQFSNLIDDDTMAKVARKNPSLLPSFRYIGPRLHQGKRTLLLGDCAHTVKPYFGLGANSALEDVQWLKRSLIEHGNNDWTSAVRSFSQRRAPEAKSLVRISRELDRPGRMGFVTFVLPLILDSIFHRLAPAIFTPNTISMLQKEGYAFSRVAWRKRQDRILQLLILGLIGSLVTNAVQRVLGMLARTLGHSTWTIMGGLISIGTVVTFLRKFSSNLVPGTAPADVLSKTQAKITFSKETIQFAEKGKDSVAIELR